MSAGARRASASSLPSDGSNQGHQYSSKAANPLTSRVTSVLSTSYTDTEFRESLSLLDSRQTQNDGQTRRRFRLGLQKEVMDQDGEIIDKFGDIAEQLRGIRAIIGTLNSDYATMKSRVYASHSETLPTLKEAGSLLKERKDVEQKQEILAAVKRHFILSEDEVAALTSTAEPVNEAYFAALSKAKKISQDCEVLLGFENQTLGSELMEQSSKNVNLGYQKLYKWTQKELKALNLENPQMSSTMRRALRVLTQRPSLFQNCLDFFAEARQRILLDSFHAALTGTTASGADDPTIKPIDLTAHDPLRYVSDMLAWIHSAAVGEREVLEVLFVAEGEELVKGLSHGRDTEVWRLVAEEEENQEEFNALNALNSLVDRGVAGASRIMRQRVEHVIQTNEETIPAYKLVSLISFYRITFEKLLSSNSALQECMTGLETEALRQFRALVRDHIATLRGEFQQTPTDLSPPIFLLDSLKQLDAIITTYETSLSTTLDDDAEFDTVLGEAFEPFLAGCEDMAKSLRLPDSLIFMINCRYASTKSLASFGTTKSRAEALAAATNQDAKQLIEDQLAFLREESGLSGLLPDRSMQGEIEGKLQVDDLAQASQALDDFLPSAHMDAIERLRNLQDSQLARTITEQAAEEFCSAFDVLEQSILQQDAKRNSEESSGLRAAFPRTAAEIRVLLS